jgi:hypothetical protein
MDFTIEHVMDNELKEKYVHGFGEYPDNFIQELIESEFWALASENKCYGIGTIVENNADTARVSHYLINDQLLETDVAVHFYINMEKYCVEKNYKLIMVRIPESIKGMTVPMRNFFKKVGFKSPVKEMGAEGNFILLFKRLRGKEIGTGAS